MTTFRKLSHPVSRSRATRSDRRPPDAPITASENSEMAERPILQLQLYIVLSAASIRTFRRVVSVS